MEETKENQYHKETKKELFFEIIRFLIVGGTATIIDYAIFYLFREVLLPARLIENNGVWDIFSIIIATALGFTGGLIVNWLLSISFVFKNVKDKKASRSKKSFIIFTLIGLIGLGITELGMLLGVNLLPDFAIFGMDKLFNLAMKEWVMKVIMTIIVLVWNYVGRKLFVFK